jgi:hypothetical protein
VPPVQPVGAFPGIPNSPDIYTKAHPDRVEKFPSSTEILIIHPHLIENTSHGDFRHELNHDAESVFWLLLYWAMVVQPEGSFPKARIDAGSWGNLNGDYESRQDFIRGGLSHITHPFYEPLRPLIKNLAAILVNDSHWLPASDPRKDPFYITEAFQRLILNFIIDNRGEEFMDHRVDKTFRKVQDIQASHGSSMAHLPSLDAASRESVDPVGCVCGSMNSCPFLLLCLQGTDDVEMDGNQTTGDVEMDSTQ